MEETTTITAVKQEVRMRDWAEQIEERNDRTEVVRRERNQS